jgi:monofunctional glycosyltransferase
MAAKKKRKDKKWWRITKRILLYWLLFQPVYILYGKWFNPPITFMQSYSVITGHGLKRTYISSNKIPAHVKLALIASEDQEFATHGGFDWDAIGKAVKGQSKHGFGGTSTISQQVAKNYFLWHGWGPTKFLRKIVEFPYTKAIELTWSKQRILEAYLNICEMGDGVYGIQAAAQKYFNKDASQLTRSEAAQIIACLPNPKAFTVKPMSNRVSWRYKQILQQMHNLEDNIAIKKVIGLQ